MGFTFIIIIIMLGFPFLQFHLNKRLLALTAHTNSTHTHRPTRTTYIDPQTPPTTGRSRPPEGLLTLSRLPVVQRHGLQCGLVSRAPPLGLLHQRTPLLHAAEPVQGQSLESLQQ